MIRTSRTPEETRATILRAAQEVFSEAGLVGATTREIARVAQINEVTLFRHFPHKEQLLAAVIQNVMALQAEALARQQEWTQDLHRDLEHYARVYTTAGEVHEAMIRTLIGEAKRRPEYARQIIHDAVQPLRDKLVAYLKQHQNLGLVRSDLELEIAVDLFTGMLLNGILMRGAATLNLGYSSERYITNAVDLFVRGIQAKPGERDHAD